jgi:hypothetical protein
MAALIFIRQSKKIPPRSGRRAWKEVLNFGPKFCKTPKPQPVGNCRQKSKDNPSVVLAFQLNSQVLNNEKNSKK